MFGQRKLLGAALLTVFALSQSATSATIGFKQAVNYPVGTTPVAVATGDFNGDGKLDLAVVNNGNAGAGDDGSVSILLGNGDGTFQAAANLPAGKNPSSIAVADFNGDNRLDLAVINADGGIGNVGVLLGNGDGTFQSPVDYATGAGPQMVALGDFNGDRKLDLVASNNIDGTVSVLLGNSDGTFQSHVDYGTGGGPDGVVVADFNGDGKADIAVATFPGGVTILAGNGDGTFHQSWTSAPQRTTSLFVGDVNKDGKADLVADRGPSGKFVFSVAMFLSNGDGTFSQASDPDTGVCHNVSPTTADFDGDGNPDLAVVGGYSIPSQGIFCGGTELDLLILAGNGDGTFQSPALTFPVGSAPGQLATADLNGDKSPDVVVLNPGDNSISVLLNTVSTDFSVSASAVSPGTVSPGQRATSTVSLSLLNAFDNPVSLTCSVQPAQGGSPTCSLNASSVTFDASGKATAQLTITAGAAAASLIQSSTHRDSQPWHLVWLPIAGLAFAGAGLGRNNSNRRKLLGLSVGCVLLAGLIFQSACGSSGGPKSKVYTVTVTGTAGSTQHSTTVTLTVQ